MRVSRAMLAYIDLPLSSNVTVSNLNVKCIQDVPFLVSLSTAGLLHGELASAKTSHNCCRARGQDKTDAVCYIALRSLNHLATRSRG